MDGSRGTSKRTMIAKCVLGLVTAATIGAGCGNSSAPPLRAGSMCDCPCASASVASAAAPSAPPSASIVPTTPLAEGDLVKILQAGEHAQAAMRRFAWHNGAGCVAELDEHDRLDTRPVQASTDPEASLAMVRAECMMLAGKCDAGRQLFKAAFAASQGENGSPEQTDKVTDAIVGMYCHAANMSPRDQVLTARAELTAGAWTTTKTVAECQKAYETVMKNRATVVPRDEDDAMVKDPLGFLYAAAPNCLARAGDCAAAWKAYEEIVAEKFKGQAWIGKPDVVRSSFESLVPRCK